MFTSLSGYSSGHLGVIYPLILFFFNIYLIYCKIVFKIFALIAFYSIFILLYLIKS